MSSLSAAYASPNGTQNFSAQLPVSPPSPSPSTSSQPSPADRVAYLAAMQAHLKTLQSDINAFLTQKMADDKAGDANEEDNYGEELVDDD